ncbi:MAG: putative sugar nucleotidyl transferase [Candidatus Marinamargulisbacteria bacterium]|nr:putative sugar nucleotidyl transferase [Candidatus Marinamargulisbacteria bacterium]
MNVAIFEDNRYAQFQPMVMARPVYELVLGHCTVLDRFQHYFSDILTAYCRPHLKSIASHQRPTIGINWLGNTHQCLFLNARVIMDRPLHNQIMDYGTGHPYIVVSDTNDVIAVCASSDLALTIHDYLMTFSDGQTLINNLQSVCSIYTYSKARILKNIWDLVALNQTLLGEDGHLNSGNYGIIKGELDAWVSIRNDEQVFIDQGVRVEPFVFIDADHGPVYIERDVVIRSHTRIKGPAYIGAGSQILGGVITASSIGSQCKIHGEVSHSVIHSYTNKAHDGFLGHSYVGEWVNLGAMTTNSNLKNTYGSIQVETADARWDSGQQFLGVCMGDHVKTAVGTLLRAGTMVGYGSTLLGRDHCGWVPPFSWGEALNYTRQQLPQFLRAVERMMQRRTIQLRTADKKLMALLFEYAHS